MLKIDKAVFQSYPDAKMGLLALENVDASAPADQAAATAAEKALRAKYGHLDRAGLKAMDPIRHYVDYYKKFGYSYHVLGQLESILSGKRSLSAPTGLLGAMFQIELEYMLLTAGHDLSALHLPLELKLATGEERFESISGKPVSMVKDDLMVTSGESIISAILRGPDSQSRINKSTTGVLFTVYAPQGIDSASIDAMLQALKGRILTFSPASQTLCMAVYTASGQ